MARPRLPVINWKRELNSLDRFLRADGGVVHVRTTADSPASAFAKSLRSLMEYGSWGRPWRTVQIDGNNAATHYLSDMIVQFEKTFRLQSLDTTAHTNTQVHVASDVSAGRDVRISDISIYVPEDRTELHRRANGIIDSIASNLKGERIGIFFFESDRADRRELAGFRAMLWDNGLEKLVGNGLVLVDISSVASQDWPPTPDLVIDLPAQYDAQSRQNAVDDLAEFAVTQGFFPTIEESRAFATTMLANNPNPKDMYANLAAVLSRMNASQ